MIEVYKTGADHKFAYGDRVTFAKATGTFGVFTGGYIDGMVRKDNGKTIIITPVYGGIFKGDNEMAWYGIKKSANPDDIYTGKWEENMAEEDDRKEFETPEDRYYKSTSEHRVVNETTGGEKGQKLARMDLIPAKPLYELAEHFGKGCKKYTDRNWERGYKWSLSYGAAMRHSVQFWDGEDLDPETGSKHAIAAAWHWLAIAEFMETHPELDDRVKTIKEKS